MFVKSVLVVISVLSLSSASHADPIFELEPGNWEKTVTLTLTPTSNVMGVPIVVSPTTMTIEHCINAEDSKFSAESLAKMLTKTPERRDRKCDLSVTNLGQRALEYTTTCYRQDLEIVTTNKITVDKSGKSMFGEGESKITESDMSMVAKSTSVLKHLGGC